jgi:hypothetical protein
LLVLGKEVGYAAGIVFAAFVGVGGIYGAV